MLVDTVFSPILLFLVFAHIQGYLITLHSSSYYGTFIELLLLPLSLKILWRFRPGVQQAIFIYYIKSHPPPRTHTHKKPTSF